MISHDAGYYCIIDKKWTYCNLIAAGVISTCAGVRQELFTSISLIDGDDCPIGWTKITQSGVSFCCPPENDPAVHVFYNTFSNNRVSYISVCMVELGDIKRITVFIRIEARAFISYKRLLTRRLYKLFPHFI